MLKWIRCSVTPSRRAAFDQAQRAWSAVADMPGFVAQFGGWDRDEACILAIWSDADLYRRFMSEDHDRIQGQPTYDSVSIDILAIGERIPGHNDRTVHESVERAAILRVAECRVRIGREGHFAEAQRTVWNPGMAECCGMLGGWFMRSSRSPQEYAVFTLWDSVENHEAYQRRRFPALARSARPEEDTEAIQSRLITLAPEWVVVCSQARVS